jgi:hypothetical protein
VRRGELVEIADDRRIGSLANRRAVAIGDAANLGEVAAAAPLRHDRRKRPFAFAAHDDVGGRVRLEHGGGHRSDLGAAEHDQRARTTRLDDPAHRAERADVPDVAGEPDIVGLVRQYPCSDCVG